MKIKLISLLFIIFLFSCTSKKAFNKKITSQHSVEEQKTDLSIVKNSLKKHHPGLYWYIDKKELDFKFDSLKKTIKDSATTLEFYRQLAPIVASVKCGHTRLVYPGIKLNKFKKDSLKKIGDRPLSQLNFFVDNNRLFIKSVNKKKLENQLTGAEVLKIEDVPVSKVINKAKGLFASDGYNQTFYPAVLSRFFEPYYYLNYGKSDSIKLFLEKADSTYYYTVNTIKPVKEEKKLLTPEEVSVKKIADKAAKKLKRKNRYKGVDKFGSPFLALKYDSVLNQTAIMTVKSFAFKQANFSRFFRESFKALEEKNTAHLILDLRNNGGGNLLNCNRLFRYLYSQPHQFTGKAYTKNSYLKRIKYEDNNIIEKVLINTFYPFIFLSKLILERKDSLGYYSYIPTNHIQKPIKHGFKGELIVLINGYSFSATSLLSANLQSVKRGTFIGEETGGGYNQCSAGRIPFVNLPNTGLKLRLPLKEIKLYKKRALYGRGVFPDVEVKESFSDVLEKRDVVMEKAKRLIDKDIP
ncbi:MAG TPA: S41 family peptidase [Pelobium sp.]|nr:S41 family peptidase [Pelobium sp.]